MQQISAVVLQNLFIYFIFAKAIRQLGVIRVCCSRKRGNLLNQTAKPKEDTCTDRSHVLDGVCTLSTYLLHERGSFVL